MKMLAEKTLCWTLVGGVVHTVNLNRRDHLTLQHEQRKLSDRTFVRGYFPNQLTGYLSSNKPVQDKARV
jgi:hypothetical protein